MEKQLRSWHNVLSSFLELGAAFRQVAITGPWAASALFGASTCMAMPDRIPRVMISSTSRDLKSHRAHVHQACTEQKCFPLWMEDLPASEQTSLDASLRLVDQADIFIGVIAYRYGFIPPGQTKSVTHLEYVRACERRIPTLIFLMHISHPVLPSDVETGDGAVALEAFKSELKNATVVDFFSSDQELHTQVVLALANAMNSPPVEASPSKEPLEEAGIRKATVQAAFSQPPFQVNSQVQQNSSGWQIRIDVGFSRLWFRNDQGQRLPVVCGCTSLQTVTSLSAGSYSGGARVKAPPSSKAFVTSEAWDLVVRIEGSPSKPIIEGSAVLDFDATVNVTLHATTIGSDPDPPPARPAGIVPPERPAGIVSLHPEWFTVERLPSAVGFGAPFDDPSQVVLNAWIDGMIQENVLETKFSF